MYTAYICVGLLFFTLCDCVGFCCFVTVIVNFDTVRVNVSAIYILIISDFFAKPFRQCQELFVDHQTAVIDPNFHLNADGTDGCGSSSVSSPLTISAKLKQCEVVLFAEPTKSNSRVLLIKV